MSTISWDKLTRRQDCPCGWPTADAEVADRLDCRCADGELRIRHSTEADFERMMQIYERARAFMAENGNPRQWGATNWPPADLIHEDIAAGRSYVCTAVVDGRESVVGTFVYIQGVDVDPTYLEIEDGAWGDDSEYGAVHRLASSGDVAGVGSFCLDWALAQCGHVRVDTHYDNHIMLSLLEKKGYERRGVIYVVEDNDPRFAFELSV
ncbi:MAG: GNAT family N-acetyltransferase [Firmicutes bacterium]|nr:GNAT family N-acetyltransferase [Bacillota bacterium]